MAGAIPRLRQRLKRTGTLPQPLRLNPRLTLTPLASRIFHAGLACAALAAATCAYAGDLSFTGGLSEAERTAAGIAKLAPPQTSALDALVARDVTLAHEGGVTGFSADFLERHSEKERVSAVLDALSSSERGSLDRFAARAIALGPPPDQGFRYAPPPTPPPKPPATETEVTQPQKMELHGDVSFTVGGGSHGQSFYGTSMDAYLTDPKHGFTVGVGFSEFRGKGLLDLCSPYGVYGPYGPYGANAPLLGGPPYSSW